jgi:hypothetical protein
MHENLINALERQKMKVFGTCDSTEQALKEAHEMLAACPKMLVTTAVIQYHNTVVSAIQQLIKEDMKNGSPS